MCEKKKEIDKARKGGRDRREIGREREGERDTEREKERKIEREK